MPCPAPNAWYCPCHDPDTTPMFPFQPEGSVLCLYQLQVPCFTPKCPLWWPCIALLGSWPRSKLQPEPRPFSSFLPHLFILWNIPLMFHTNQNFWSQTSVGQEKYTWERKGGLLLGPEGTKKKLPWAPTQHPLWLPLTPAHVPGPHFSSGMVTACWPEWCFSCVFLQPWENNQFLHVIST